MTRALMSSTDQKRKVRLPERNGLLALLLPVLMWGMALPLSAQSLLRRVDSVLTANYRKVNYDTAYLTRPQTKWTLRARMNLSGLAIEAEGIDNGQNFDSELVANSKATLSLGVSYLGVSLNLALNPAKMLGKYHDYELNLNCYRRNFGFDIVYQDAKNFKGWYDLDGAPRFDLPDGTLKVNTLNLNAYYAFNHRRFAYPAAFSQSYIQRRSAGSFLLAASAMGQQAVFDMEEQPELRLKMTNIGIGGGYGYNFVPGQGWLLHLSLLPTFIVYSKASLTYDDDRVSLNYRFPEFIVTGRAAVVRQWSRYFVGLSAVYNITNINGKDNLTIYNSKWLARAFFGVRL